MEYLLQELISGKSNLSSSLTRKINICSLDTVSDLGVQKEILLFDVTEESEEKEVACQGHSGTRRRNKKNIEDITISLF